MKNKKTPAVKPIYTDKITCVIDGMDIEISYRKRLPFSEYAKLVTDVAYQVANAETGYNPFVYDVALKKNIIEVYSDYVLPDDVNEIYNSTIVNDIFDKLSAEIHNDYINAVSDIEKLIEFKKNQLENKSEFDVLCKTLTDVLVKFEGKYGKAINPKAINSVIEKLGAMEPNEKGFIDALIDKVPKADETTEKSKIVEFRPSK